MEKYIKSGGDFVPHFPKRGDCAKKVEDPCNSAYLSVYSYNRLIPLPYPHVQLKWAKTAHGLSASQLKSFMTSNI